MAGTAQNPGIQDKYLFRYQYLLIDVGTKVLRAIFDTIVHHDFAAYLTTNSNASRTLTSLMTGRNRKITADQEKLFPPQMKHPTSSMYDVTLLTCLLRNICGLRPAGDQVWCDPLPTDHSLEADITRLRKCRNEIMHTDTMHIAEKDLDDKWQKLVEILKRLNKAAKITNLSKLMNYAKYTDIDEELKHRYLETLKTWVPTESALEKMQEVVAEVKRGQSDIEDVVAVVKRGLSNVQEDVAEVKRGQSDIQEDVAEVKRGQSDIQEDVAEVKRGQSDIQEDVAEVKRGQSDIQEDVAEVKRGQSDIQEEVAGVKRGQSDIQEDVAEVKRGQSDIQEVVAEVKRGQSEIQEDVAEVKRGQSDIQEHVAKVKRGQSDIQGDVAEVKRSLSDIQEDVADVKRGLSVIPPYPY